METTKKTKAFLLALSVVTVSGLLWGVMKKQPIPSSQEKVHESVTLPTARVQEEQVPATRNAESPLFDEMTDSRSNKEIIDSLIQMGDTDAKEQVRTYGRARGMLVQRGQQGDISVVSEIKEAIPNMVPGKQYAFGLILKDIATPESLAALWELGNSQDPRLSETRRDILTQIQKIGRVIHIGETKVAYRTELSPLLEQYLDIAINNSDPQPFFMVAAGLSSVGSAQAIDKLLDVYETRATDEQRELIEEFLQEVRNPQGSAPLQKRLLNDPDLSSPVSRIAGNSLVAMANPEATDALLQWAALTEGPQMRNQALTWFEQLMETGSEQELNVLLEAGVRYTFRDPEMRKSILLFARQKDKEFDEN